MKVLCVFGQHNYGDPRRGEGYEYTNFLPALHRLGHEVEFFDSQNRTLYDSFEHLNSSLLKKVEEYRPDVLLAVLTHYEIWIETWEIIRESGICTTINWATDDSWRYTQFSRFVAPHFDAIATTYQQAYEQYLSDGHRNVICTQWAANPDLLHPPLSARDCKYDVIFIGTAHGNRAKRIEFVRSAGIRVECFGHGWPNGPLASAEIPMLTRSAQISLNFANSSVTWNDFLPKRINQIKARIFEVPGYGGMLLTEDAPGLDRYYVPGREIASFRSNSDLRTKLLYYLSKPVERDAIAKAGWERTCREHTYDARLSMLFEFARTQKNMKQRQIEPALRGTINWRRFERATGRNMMRPREQQFREALAKFCSVAWGPVRGPRAARRLLFELSWRILGEETYTASSIPGRLFYKES